MTLCRKWLKKSLCQHFRDKYLWQITLSKKILKPTLSQQALGFIDNAIGRYHTKMPKEHSTM